MPGPLRADDDRFHDQCGLFGIFGHPEAANLTYLGLYALLGAYIQRLKTGTGQYVETSLVEAGLAWTFWEFGAYFGGGEVPTATGTRHRRSAGGRELLG